MNPKIFASGAFCAAIATATYILLFSDSKDLSQETVSKETKSKVLVSSKAPSRDLMSLPVRGSSKHGADCAHCIAKKESGKETSSSSHKPVDHQVLPSAFDTTLISNTKDGEDFRYISTSSDIFSQIKESDIGNTLVIGFSEDLSVKGILKSFKNYQSADSAVAGMIELSGYSAKLTFFMTSEKTTAQILFNEKSKALVYQENETELAFVETSISELFCTYDPQAVYPMNHPSNQ